jgi:hypothetical protein
MTDTSLLNILLEAVADRLTDTLIDDVSVGDPTLAGLVRSGKLQADPTAAKINVLVHFGSKEWPHEVNTNHTGLRAPIREIGGVETVYQLRRFRVELALFFSGERDRDVARTKAHVVLSRAQHALMTIEMPVQDSFGESPMLSNVASSYLLESGGPGNFIWRGELKVEFLTSFSPV